MSKTILITGSTDGIGLETAKMLQAQGHQVLLHGRSLEKLERAKSALSNGENVPTYQGDLSNRDQVIELAKSVAADYPKLDVLINNAGVPKVPQAQTPAGLDLRFVVNTVAPYLLTQLLLPTISKMGRVVNLSSAAQAPVSLAALKGEQALSDNSAYAQSKLALTMWSRQLGLTRASIGDDFADANAQYFDNDSGRFASPNHDATDDGKMSEVTQVVKALSDLPVW